MKINHSLAIIISALLILGLAACERSLTGGTISGGSDNTSQELTASGTAVMDTLYLFSTQTAMAAQQGQPTLPIPADAQLTQAAAQTVAPTEVLAPTETPLPTSPAILAPTATPGLPASYTLQKGEFPYCIARRFNVNPIEMLQLSGLPSSGTLSPGTVLKIPQKGSPFPGNRMLQNHPTSYTVQAGDTIYSIACLFGDVDPASIAFVNNLEKPYTLQAGQVINIP